MTDNEVSRAALDAILAAGVDYVLVGGLAVVAHTFSRTALDVDFVVAAPLGAISQIAAHFSPAFRLDPQPPTELLAGTFRWIVDVEASAFRIGIFHLTDDPHHQELFRRRLAMSLAGFSQAVWIPTAEDLILQKLRWARSKDLDDARNLLAVQGDTIDFVYIEKWCAQHGTLERLAEVRAGIPPGI